MDKKQKLKTVNLPRKYEYKEGVSRPEYKKYKGWNKISYSQYSSFKESAYRGDYFAEKFLNLRLPQGIFGYYGNAVGDYLNLQDQRVDEYLDDEDKAILDAIERPANAEYEYEILIDLEPFGLKNTVLQGFSDMQFEVAPKTLDVCDYKTLNLSTKKKFYESADYKQLNIYGYGLEELGFKINETYVIGLGRKGNTLERGAVHGNTGNRLDLRLSGEVERIENPYNRQEAIKDIQGICKIIIEISEYYKIYNKYFK